MANLSLYCAFLSSAVSFRGETDPFRGEAVVAVSLRGEDDDSCRCKPGIDDYEFEFDDEKFKFGFGGVVNDSFRLLRFGTGGGGEAMAVCFAVLSSAFLALFTESKS